MGGEQGPHIKQQIRHFVGRYEFSTCHSSQCLINHGKGFGEDGGIGDNGHVHKVSGGEHSHDVSPVIDTRIVAIVIDSS
jgi:hypothetical protein